MHRRKKHIDQAALLRKAATMHLTQKNKPRIVAVASGKGGVGKSVFAINLAMILAGVDRRVLLFDADTNLANVDSLLGASPKHRLGDVLRGEKDLSEILISPRPYLHILPGNSGDYFYPKCDSRVQDHIIESIVASDDPYDVLIIDSAAGISPEVINYSVLSDETIVISNPEPTAILDAYAVMKMIWLKKKQHVFKLVINQVRNASEAKDAATKLKMAAEHFLRITVQYIGHLPYDKRVKESVVRQIPVVQSFPKSSFVESLKTIAQNGFIQSEQYSERREVTV